MIKVQFKDGQTLSFDLTQDHDRLSWNRFSNGKGWFNSITAMAILNNKTLHTLPAPNSGLKPYGFGADLIRDEKRRRISGESVWYCVNGVRVELTVYNTNQKVTKVTVSKLEVNK